MTRFLIGVDDTDSSKSPTTGDLVRRLAESLQAGRWAAPQGVTRHQLLVKKHIPYTGHNSSVCMSVEAGDMEDLWETARDFFSLESERHSNTGLCISRAEAVPQEVMAWGRRAKESVLDAGEAQQVAAKARVRLAPIKGNGNGVIGALAALGLHREGNDGRFLWLPGLADLRGSCSVRQIFDRSEVERVCSLEDVELPLDEMVDLTDGTRPLLRRGQATLYVERKKHGWVVLDRERIRQLSG